MRGDQSIDTTESGAQMDTIDQHLITVLSFGFVYCTHIVNIALNLKIQIFLSFPYGLPLFYHMICGAPVVAADEFEATAELVDDGRATNDSV